MKNAKKLLLLIMVLLIVPTVLGSDVVYNYETVYHQTLVNGRSTIGCVFNDHWLEPNDNSYTTTMYTWFLSDGSYESNAWTNNAGTLGSPCFYDNINLFIFSRQVSPAYIKRLNIDARGRTSTNGTVSDNFIALDGFQARSTITGYEGYIYTKDISSTGVMVFNKSLSSVNNLTMSEIGAGDSFNIIGDTLISFKQDTDGNQSVLHFWDINDMYNGDITYVSNFTWTATHPSYYDDVLKVDGHNISRLYIQYGSLLYQWKEFERLDLITNDAPDTNWEYQTPATLLTTNRPNITFYFNLTDDFIITPDVICSLYNDVGLEDNNTFTTNGIKNLTATNVSEGQHDYFVNCTDSAGLSDLTSTKTVETDYTTPILLVSSPKLDNTTVFYTFLNVSFYAQDVNLARYVVNVTNSTGVLLYSELVNVTQTNITVELFINSTTWNNGIFDIQIGVADE